MRILGEGDLRASLEGQLRRMQREVDDEPRNQGLLG
jgi:hypothetical protein